MSNATELLKRHVWCTIIIAATISLSAIIVACSSDVSLVSHLSLTSAIVSIVLAIIVIVYMFLQDHRSSQNIMEMRNLIDQASHAMTDKADLMANEAQSMKQQMAEMAQASSSNSEPATPPLEIKEALSIDVSAYGTFGLLTLYSMAKSYEFGKAMSLVEISKLLHENNTDHQGKFIYYALAVIMSFRAFLGTQTIIWSTDINIQKVIKLPDGIMKSVTAQIDKDFESHRGENIEEYNKLKGHQDIIDNYFNNL